MDQCMTVNRTRVVRAGFISQCFLFVILGWFEGLSQKFLSSPVSKMLLLAGTLFKYCYCLIFLYYCYIKNVYMVNLSYKCQVSRHIYVMLLF